MIDLKEMETKILIKRTIIIGVSISIISYFLMKEALPFIRGIAFGLIYSLLDFRLLELNLAKSVKMNSEAAKKYIFSRYIFRYTLTGVIIYVSITNPKIHVMGTIIGLLILKLVIYLSSLFSKNKDSR